MIGYCDGSCNNRTGEGGWGWAILNDDHEVLHHGAGRLSKSTSNRAEMTAILECLRYIKAKELPIRTIRTDSNLSAKTLMLWYPSWVRDGVTGDRKNIDLIAPTWELRVELKVHIEWVRGHAGFYGNELVDRLAGGENLRQAKWACREFVQEPITVASP